MISKPLGSNCRIVEAAGRRFLLMRRSYRLGPRGSRYTLIDWHVTERGVDGKAIAQVTQDGCEPHTVARAEALIQRFVASDGPSLTSLTREAPKPQIARQDHVLGLAVPSFVQDGDLREVAQRKLDELLGGKQ